MFVTKRINNQKGQSLLYVSILIVVLISGVFFVYDIGSMVNTKIKFQNGADSAALASVAVKITKHHTEQMIRTSMFHESVAAQTEQRAAQALLIKIVLDINAKPNVVDPANPPLPPGPGPGGMPPNVVQPDTGPTPQQKTDAANYRRMANLTYRHAIKLHREKKALEAYYKWLADDTIGVGPETTTEAARIGLRANTLGLMSIKNPGLAQNLKILTDKNELVENQRKFAEIGGVPYSNEGATIVGNFGRSFVEIEGNGASTSQGSSLLKYFNNYTMTTNAAARIASSDELKLGKTPIGLFNGGYPFEMLWYTPRLMSIEKKTDIVIH